MAKFGYRKGKCKMRKYESAKDKVMSGLREVLSMCDLEQVLYNRDNLILFRSYVIEFDKMLKYPERGYKCLYDNSFNAVINMYIDLLLNITDGEYQEKNLTVQALKLKMYQNNLEDIKRDIVIRLAAFKQVVDKRKFLFGERAKLVVNLCSYYMNILNNLTAKENMTYANIENFLKRCSEIPYSEEKASLMEKREQLLAMIEQVMPEKLAEFNVQRLNKNMELAQMEQVLEVYAYNNRALPVVLEHELQVLKSKGDNNSKTVQDLELKCEIFALFGLNEEGQTRLLKK